MYRRLLIVTHFRSRCLSISLALSRNVAQTNNMYAKRPKIWSLAQTATSEGPPYRIAPGDWPSHLSDGSDMYGGGGRHPGDGCGGGALPPMGSHHHRPGQHAGWPDESSISLLSAPISTSSYQQKVALSSRLVSCPAYPTSFGATTASANESSFSTAGFATAQPNGTDDSLVHQHQSHHHTMYGADMDASRTTNTFLGRVFSDYVSAGQGMELNGVECDRSGGSYADDGLSPPDSRCVDLVKRADNHMSSYAAGLAGASAFRPMKR